nr:uncharacterized protein LOC101236808 [Hydra vulgaris]
MGETEYTLFYLFLHFHKLVKRNEGKPYSYPPAPPLPESRLNSDFAFKCIALNYAVPLYIKDDYDDSTLNKAWIFLFTCCSSRSILLDLLADCSSRSCIMGIRQFIRRRGVPEIIYSDNGSQFVSIETQSFAANQYIKWKFNTPLSPWWGGLFEQQVRMTKRCLKKALKTSKSSHEEIRTLLSEIEMVLNNRPLTYLYNNQGDEALTPNHLVFGHKLRCKTCLSVCDEIEQDKQIQDKNCKRQLWKLARVKELIYSNDGVVGVAIVCYIQEGGKSCLVNRPINKLYPTEYSDKKKLVIVIFVNEKSVPLLVNGGGSVEVYSASRNSRNPLV